MGNFNLDDYVPVHDRLQEFWENNPTGRVTTELLFLSEDFKNVVIKASVYREGASPDEPAATGIASEVNGEGYINKTSFIENAETSAVGRALANLGIQVKKGIASREEMQKVQRMQPAPRGFEQVYTQEPPTQQLAPQQPVAVNQAGVDTATAPASPLASDPQVRMMHAIAKGGDLNLEMLCLEKFKCQPEQLSKQQATAFIDELKAMTMTAAGQAGPPPSDAATRPQMNKLAHVANAMGVALSTLIEQEFPNVTPDTLSKKQASHLIDTYGTK